MSRKFCIFVHMDFLLQLQKIIQKLLSIQAHRRFFNVTFSVKIFVYHCVCLCCCIGLVQNNVKQIALCWNICKFEHLDILGYFPVISSETIHICYNKGLKYSMSIIFKRYSKGEVYYSVLLYIYTYKIMNGDAYHWPHIQSLVQINKSNYILCILASKLFIILGGLFSFLCIK